MVLTGHNQIYRSHACATIKEPWFTCFSPIIGFLPEYVRKVKLKANRFAKESAAVCFYSMFVVFWLLFMP